MATISQKGTPGIGAGILMPDLTHHFRVKFPHKGRFSEEASNILTQQTINCHIDYLNRTLSINIEQPSAHCDLHEIIFDITQTMGRIMVESIASDGNANYGILFNSCECIKHEYNLSYAESTTATHKLMFTYKSFVTKNAFY